MPEISRNFHLELRESGSDELKLFDLIVGERTIAVVVMKKNTRPRERMVGVVTEAGFGNGFDTTVARGVIWIGAQKAQEIANEYREPVCFYPLIAKKKKVQQWLDQSTINRKNIMYPEKKI
ncbi:MAG: hypothetical protein ABI758_05315 [Candidatus Woesebacteria bacterium]